MKKTIVVISSVLQFLAIVIIIVAIRTGILFKDGRASGTSLILTIIGAVVFISLHLLLKKGYAQEVEKAESIMQKPNNNYGWLALTIFLLVMIAFLIYALI
jgi:hypothetical protein